MTKTVIKFKNVFHNTLKSAITRGIFSHILYRVTYIKIAMMLVTSKRKCRRLYKVCI